jgi:hypothetical protein
MLLSSYSGYNAKKHEPSGSRPCLFLTNHLPYCQKKTNHLPSLTLIVASSQTLHNNSHRPEGKPPRSPTSRVAPPPSRASLVKAGANLIFLRPYQWKRPPEPPLTEGARRRNQTHHASMGPWSIGPVTRTRQMASALAQPSLQRIRASGAEGQAAAWQKRTVADAAPQRVDLLRSLRRSPGWHSGRRHPWRAEGAEIRRIRPRAGHR